MAGLTRSRRAATAAMVAAALVASVGLGGCEWRRETPPPVWPTPDAVTAARDLLAEATAEVLAAADRELAAEPAETFAATVRASALVHLEALGGVYVAYPDASAAPAEASASATPEPVLTLDDAIAAAREAASAASAEGDPELSALARAIDLEWALRLTLTRSPGRDAAPSPSPSPDPASGDDVLPAIAGPTVDASTRTPFPPARGTAASDAAFAPGAATSLSPEDLAAIALAHDHARFAYETIAAWEFGPARTAALDLADFHGARSDEFAATLPDDPRTPVYQLRDANLPDTASRRALELDVERHIGLTLAAALDDAPESELDWLLNATFDALVRASTAWGFEETDIPTLPGLRVGAPGS